MRRLDELKKDELIALAEENKVDLSGASNNQERIEALEKAGITEAPDADDADNDSIDDSPARAGATDLSYDTAAVQPPEDATPVYKDARTGNLVTPNNAVIAKTGVKKHEGGAHVKESVALKAERGDKSVE